MHSNLIIYNFIEPAYGGKRICLKSKNDNTANQILKRPKTIGTETNVYLLHGPCFEWFWEQKKKKFKHLMS